MRAKLLEKLKRNKKIVIDMLLSIVANALPIATLQLVVYPVTAKAIGSERYGLMITIYSIWMVIAYSLGNVLNNIRLINNNYYEESGQEGDFIILVKRWNLISVIAVVIFTVIYYREGSVLDYFISAIIGICFLLKSYLEVGFRIKLNYVGICITNLLQAIGFLIGCYITYKTGYWQSIFLTGFLMSNVYLTVKTGLLGENTQKTKIFSKVNAEVNELTFATVVGCLADYADKLILYPLMGGHVVSIYYTATILGKIIGMLTGPINAVVLSYISKWQDSRKNFLYRVLFVATIVAVIGYFLTLLVSRPVLTILFPQWVDEVMQYIPVTTIAVCISIVITMIQPFVLKFCDIKWQILISAVGLITYFCASLLLWRLFGLRGFCVGTVIGVFSKLMIMLFVYWKNTGTEQSISQ